MLLLEYFSEFGSKPACFVDLRPFLSLLGEQQQGDFLHHVWTTAGFPRNPNQVFSDRLPQSVSDEPTLGLD